MELPEIRIVTSFLQADSCAICSREWAPGPVPVPTAYTSESIDAGDPPQPVCDFCVEGRYPREVSEELAAERRRFWAS